MTTAGGAVETGGAVEAPRAGTGERIAAAVRMCRPYSLLWFVSLPTATMALWLGDGSVDVTRLLLLIAAFALADAGLTTWNDICDIETDRASSEAQRNTRALAAGVISMRWARAQVILLESAALVIAFAIEPAFGLLLAGGVIYGLGYSARPVYAGGRPLVSQGFWLVLWPAMYGGVALVMGGDLSNGALYVLATVLFMGVAETLAKDLRDLENDTLAGKRTTPVAFGPRRAAIVSGAAFAAGSVLYVTASVGAPNGSAGLTAALAVVVALWTGRAVQIVRELLRGYDKAPARALHVGAIRVFLTVNALFLAGLTG